MKSKTTSNIKKKKNLMFSKSVSTKEQPEAYSMTGFECSQKQIFFPVFIFPCYLIRIPWIHFLSYFYSDAGMENTKS